MFGVLQSDGDRVLSPVQYRIFNKFRVCSLVASATRGMHEFHVQYALEVLSSQLTIYIDMIQQQVQWAVVEVILSRRKKKDPLSDREGLQMVEMLLLHTCLPMLLLYQYYNLEINSCGSPFFASYFFLEPARGINIYMPNRQHTSKCISTNN